MQETLFRGRSKAKSPCGSSIAYRSKAITPPRSGGSYPQVAEAIEAGVVDPSYPDEEPAQVAVYLIEFTLFRLHFLGLSSAVETRQAHLPEVEWNTRALLNACLRPFTR